MEMPAKTFNSYNNPDPSSIYTYLSFVLSSPYSGLHNTTRRTTRGAVNVTASMVTDSYTGCTHRPGSSEFQNRRMDRVFNEAEGRARKYRETLSDKNGRRERSKLTRPGTPLPKAGVGVRCMHAASGPQDS